MADSDDETKCPGCGLDDEDDSRAGHWRVFMPDATYAEFGPCKRCGWTAELAEARARIETLERDLNHANYLTDKVRAERERDDQ